MSERQPVLRDLRDLFQQSFQFPQRQPRYPINVDATFDTSPDHLCLQQYLQPLFGRTNDEPKIIFDVHLSGLDNPFKLRDSYEYSELQIQNLTELTAFNKLSQENEPTVYIEPTNTTDNDWISNLKAVRRFKQDEAVCRVGGFMMRANSEELVRRCRDPKNDYLQAVLPISDISQFYVRKNGKPIAGHFAGSPYVVETSKVENGQLVQMNYCTFLKYAKSEDESNVCLRYLHQRRKGTQAATNYLYLIATKVIKSGDRLLLPPVSIDELENPVTLPDIPPPTAGIPEKEAPSKSVVGKRVPTVKKTSKKDVERRHSTVASRLLARRQAKREEKELYVIEGKLSPPMVQQQKRQKVSPSLKSLSQMQDSPTGSPVLTPTSALSPPSTPVFPSPRRVMKSPAPDNQSDTSSSGEGAVEDEVIGQLPTSPQGSVDENGGRPEEPSRHLTQTYNAYIRSLQSPEARVSHLEDRQKEEQPPSKQIPFIKKTKKALIKDHVPLEYEKQLEMIPAKQRMKERQRLVAQVNQMGMAELVEKFGGNIKETELPTPCSQSVPVRENDACVNQEDSQATTRLFENMLLPKQKKQELAECMKKLVNRRRLPTHPNPVKQLKEVAMTSIFVETPKAETANCRQWSLFVWQSFELQRAMENLPILISPDFGIPTYRRVSYMDTIYLIFADDAVNINVSELPLQPWFRRLPTKYKNRLRHNLIRESYRRRVDSKYNDPDSDVNLKRFPLEQGQKNLPPPPRTRERIRSRRLRKELTIIENFLMNSLNATFGFTLINPTRNEITGTLQNIKKKTNDRMLNDQSCGCCLYVVGFPSVYVDRQVLFFGEDSLLDYSNLVNHCLGCVDGIPQNVHPLTIWCGSRGSHHPKAADKPIANWFTLFPSTSGTTSSRKKDLQGLNLFLSEADKLCHSNKNATPCNLLTVAVNHNANARLWRADSLELGDQCLRPTFSFTGDPLTASVLYDRAAASYGFKQPDLCAAVGAHFIALYDEEYCRYIPILCTEAERVFGGFMVERVGEAHQVWLQSEFDDTIKNLIHRANERRVKTVVLVLSSPDGDENCVALGHTKFVVEYADIYATLATGIPFLTNVVMFCNHGPGLHLPRTVRVRNTERTQVFQSADAKSIFIDPGELLGEYDENFICPFTAIAGVIIQHHKNISQSFMYADKAIVLTSILTDVVRLHFSNQNHLIVEETIQGRKQSTVTGKFINIPCLACSNNFLSNEFCQQRPRHTAANKGKACTPGQPARRSTRQIAQPKPPPKYWTSAEFERKKSVLIKSVDKIRFKTTGISPYNDLRIEIPDNVVKILRDTLEFIDPATVIPSSNWEPVTWAEVRDSLRPGATTDDKVLQRHLKMLTDTYTSHDIAPNVCLIETHFTEPSVTACLPDSWPSDVADHHYLKLKHKDCLFIFPFNSNNHWVVLVYELQKNRMVLYDSMKEDTAQWIGHIKNAQAVVQATFERLLKSDHSARLPDLKVVDLSIGDVGDGQGPTNDCGIFLVQYVEMILKHRPVLSVLQENMNQYRLLMLFEIITDMVIIRNY